MSRRIVVPNELLVIDVKRLIDEGEKVVLKTKGNSMLPFIVGSKDSVELTKVSKEVEIGDIVLAKVKGVSNYVIHRVIEVQKETFLLMGDGNVGCKELCYKQDIIAKVISIIKPNRVVDPYSKKQQFYTKIWILMLPIRRYLLKIFNKL